MNKQMLVVLWFALVLLPFGGFSQPLTLDSCYHLTRQQAPILANQAHIKQQLDYVLANIRTQWMPQLQLNAKATYQSEAIDVSLPLPPAMNGPINLQSDKDQYAVSLDVQQLIYDGGTASARKELERARSAISGESLQTDLYGLYQQVNQLYFYALLLQDQEVLLRQTMETLDERLQAIQAAIRSGAMLPGNARLLEAELLQVEQEWQEARFGFRSTLNALATLTGQPLDTTVQLQLPGFSISGNNLHRPEHEVFNATRKQLQTEAKLAGKARMPKLMAFGQAGYGKPGLNMLSNEFQPYYVVGLQFSWNPWDWQRSQRQQAIYKTQQKIVTQQEAQFNQGIQVQAQQLLHEVEKLQALLNKDQEIIAKRAEVTAMYSAQLDNGTITSAQYLEQLNAEKRARIQANIRQTKLNQAKADYLFTTGQLDYYLHKNENR